MTRRTPQRANGGARANATSSRLSALRSRPGALASVCIVWVLLVGFGLSILGLYGARPGPTGAAPPVWPAGVDATAWDRARIVVAVHPRCPCTRATVSELARAVGVVGDRVVIDALVYAPAEGDASWADTGLVRALGAIPGVRVRLDPHGRRAAAFGLKTSGHALVYGRDQRLVFSGGLTPSRGHEGACLGRTALIDLVMGRLEPDGVIRTTVYGCVIRSQAEPDRACDRCAPDPGVAS